MRAIWAILVAVLFHLVAMLPAAAVDAEVLPKVSGMTHGVHGPRVRLIMDVDPVPAFAAFTLRNPDRLVIDFPALEWALPELDITKIPYINEVRYGLFRADRARIVMDLSEPVQVERIFSERPRGNEPGKLVVDLSPTSRAEFDARAGLPEHARWKSLPPPVPDRGNGQIIVAIDPGHGGVDPGASWGRLKEKRVVLAFAKVLAEAIQARPGMTPYLVRDKDEFVPLGERVARAHRAGANVFLSIHADRVAEGKASGITIYKLSPKGSDKAATRLAERENRADLLAGADLSGESDTLARLLVELAQRGTKEESDKLATSLLSAMQGELKLLRTRPIRQANFRVLKAPDIPSLLLEIGFLDHAADRKRLMDPEWRQKAATRMAKGVADWTQVASPGFLDTR
ncbi:MAG: N-acetylmuramoyl-L-alanine amidase [Pseudomonadota bacterium]